MFTFSFLTYIFCSKPLFFFLWLCGPTRGMASSFSKSLDHTKRPTIVRRTPLDEWSARRRDLYLRTKDTYKRQTSMNPVGFEPTIPASEQRQTHTLGRAANGIGVLNHLHVSNSNIPISNEEKKRHLLLYLCSTKSISRNRNFKNVSEDRTCSL